MTGHEAVFDAILLLLESAKPQTHVADSSVAWMTGDGFSVMLSPSRHSSVISFTEWDTAARKEGTVRSCTKILWKESWIVYREEQKVWESEDIIQPLLLKSWFKTSQTVQDRNSCQFLSFTEQKYSCSKDSIVYLNYSEHMDISWIAPNKYRKYKKVEIWNKYHMG